MLCFILLPLKSQCLLRLLLSVKKQGLSVTELYSFPWANRSLYAGHKDSGGCATMLQEMSSLTKIKWKMGSVSSLPLGAMIFIFYIMAKRGEQLWHAIDSVCQQTVWSFNQNTFYETHPKQTEIQRKGCRICPSPPMQFLHLYKILSSFSPKYFLNQKIALKKIKAVGVTFEGPWLGRQHRGTCWGNGNILNLNLGAC